MVTLEKKTFVMPANRLEQGDSVFSITALSIIVNFDDNSCVQCVIQAYNDKTIDSVQLRSS